MALDAWTAFDLAAAALQLGLAAFLLRLGVGGEASRALVLFLVARSGYLVVASAAAITDDAALDATAAAVVEYHVLALFVLLLHLAVVFPVRRVPLPRAPWELLPAAVLLGAIILFRATQPALSGGIFAVSPDSPTFWLLNALALSFPVVALLLVREHARRPTDHVGHAALLLGVGLALTRVWDVAVTTVRAQEEVLSPLAAALLSVEPLIFVLVAAELLRQALRAGAAAPAARRALVVVLLAATTGVAAAAFDPQAQAETGLGSVWNLALPLLVAYAILRHHLFGIDVKIRWTIRQSTIGAAFVAVFFVVSEGAQQFFGETSGPYLGVLAAGALVFALAPLQRLAERVAFAALPAAEGARGEARAKAERIYRLALRTALRDRVLTQDEEQSLADLAQELEIGAGDARRLRAEIDAEGRRSPTKP